jgi:hypothetical protein
MKPVKFPVAKGSNVTTLSPQSTISPDKVPLVRIKPVDAMLPSKFEFRAVVAVTAVVDVVFPA